MKLNFQRIVGNPLSKLLSKEFLGWIGYVSNYLPKLEYAQRVTNSTPDLKNPYWCVWVGFGTQPHCKAPFDQIR